MAALTALSAAGGLGYAVGSALSGTELEQARHTLTRAQVVQAELAGRLLLAAQARGDALTRRLVAERRASAAQQEKLKDDLKKATDGRVCLRDSALRVLDQSPGLQVAGLPGTAGGADGAHAGRVATDTDVSGWARDAGRQYAECVSRYHALIDFNEGKQ